MEGGDKPTDAQQPPVFSADFVDDGSNVRLILYICVCALIMFAVLSLVSESVRSVVKEILTELFYFTKSMCCGYVFRPIWNKLTSKSSSARHASNNSYAEEEEQSHERTELVERRPTSHAPSSAKGVRDSGVDTDGLSEGTRNRMRSSKLKKLSAKPKSVAQSKNNNKWEVGSDEFN